MNARYASKKINFIFSMISGKKESDLVYKLLNMETKTLF